MGDFPSSGGTGIGTLLPIIMAGGSGTRLWPLSREAYPKQFLRLQDMAGPSMLQSTLLRLDGLVDSTPLVICNESHRFLVAEQLRQSDALHGNILLEPAGRGTAPAMALAALHATEDGADPLLLVLAADHIITDVPAFQNAVRSGMDHALGGALVAFGIHATRPETGYGYIRQGPDARTDAGTNAGCDAFRIDAFVEKPDRATAEGYVADGGYCWNSGMFLFKASRYLAELGRCRADILQACQQAMAGRVEDLEFIRVDAAAFRACPEDSIDYAVMEKTANAVVIPLTAGWTDVGAFGSLWEVLPKDAAGNATQGDVSLLDSQNNLVFAENAFVATIGLRDLIVVQTKDAVLVAARDRAQDVKTIVARLKAAGRTEHQLHREVHRPWGKYDGIDSAPRYQVKRITVNPGGKLSVQMHHHRAEHWVVVSGTARVSLDGHDRLLTENESIYLPIGAVHALENPGRIPLELIEVQVGPYLGEDDIVRFADRYGRGP